MYNSIVKSSVLGKTVYDTVKVNASISVHTIKATIITAKATNYTL